MNAPERGALMLVRFLSVAILGMSLLMEGLYLADCLAHHLAIGKLHCALLAIPLLAGVVLLAKSDAIAKWLSDKLDE